MKEILYFTATWCIPCKQMKPIIEQVREETGVNFRQIDTDDQFEMSEKYKVRSVPTFVLLENGEEISRARGAQTAPELTTSLEL